MTSRERVRKAFNFEEPDRVPIDLGSTYVSTITVQAYRKLLEHLGLSLPIKLENLAGQTAIIDETILRMFEVDFRAVRPGPPESGEPQPTRDEQGSSYTDEWGIQRRMPTDGYYYDLVRSPLSDADLQALKDYPSPEPEQISSTSAMAEEARRLATETEYAVVGDFAMLGIFEMSWFLRGLENFMVDLITDRTFCEVLLDRLVEVKCRLYDRYLKEVGPYLDVVTMGDDISGQRGPLFDPSIYREMIKPRHAALIRFIKQRTPAKLFFHSCGDITEFIPDFIEIGVDILNPIQVSVMDARRLKAEFGDSLVFWGGCDTQNVLPFGTIREVEMEVRRRMDEMAAGGGYVFGQVHEVQPGTPPENILSMFQSALRYGIY